LQFLIGCFVVTPEGEGQATEQAPMVFRVCMANVLISAAQKISSSSRPMFAKMIMPPLLNYLEVGTETQIRGACLQVLFTAVYHLKGPAILPFANDLLSLSVTTIQGYHPPEERMGSAKLLASLLAADEEIVKEIAPNLVNAQMAIAAVANMDASSELRALCEQLLSCMTPSSDAVLSSSPSSSLPSFPLYG
jgi:ABC-type cobalamin transport system permease subunit